MKLVVKKIFWLVVFIFVILLFGFFETKAGYISYSNNCKRSIESYKQALNVFTHYDNGELKYDDYYSGMFIDNQGILNICLVDGYDINLDSLYCKIIKRKYSYNYLNSFISKLDGKFENYSINLAYIDEINNYLVINVEENVPFSNLNAIYEYLDIPEDALVVESGKSFLCSGYAYSGTNVDAQFDTSSSSNPDWLLITSGTISFNAYDTTTCQYGIVTCNHVTNGLCYDLFYNGNYLGSPTKTQNSINIDASFIPFDYLSGINYTSIAKSGNQFYNNIYLGDDQLIIPGLKTTFFGATSGKSDGTIISASATDGFLNDLILLLIHHNQAIVVHHYILIWMMENYI